MRVDRVGFVSATAIFLGFVVGSERETTVFTNPEFFLELLL